MLLWRPALADEVRLANGDLIQGRVTSLDDGELRLATAFAGNVRVRWPDVRSVTTDETVEIRLADGTRLRGRLVPPEEALGSAEDAGESGPPLLHVATGDGVLAVDAGKIGEIGVGGAFAGYIELGYAYAVGSSWDGAHAGVFRGGARYVSEGTLAYVDGFAALGSDVSGRFERREGILEALAARRLGGPIYIDVAADGLTDPVRERTARVEAGAGLGLRFEPDLERRVFLEAGPGYAYEWRERGDDRHHMVFRASVRVDAEIAGPVRLDARGLFLLHAGRAEDVEVRLLCGPKIAIAGGLYVALRAQYEYMGVPAEEVGRHDAGFEGGVGWTF